jgi:hypothetical protein
VQAEITFAIALHWLPEGSYFDLNNVYNFSVNTVYKHRHFDMQAVDMCNLLKLNFPTPAAQHCSLQAVFCEVSSISVISACADAIDSVIVVDKRPSI